MTQRVSWLEHLSAALAAMRRDDLPVPGLCGYSRGDQFDWQTALAEPTGAVTQVGPVDVQRRPRPVAAALAKMVRAGPPS
ncbi:MAG: hypothetical protein IPM45_14915 [Acidimicrobiales bacterium]|nr:hypothetical protein [Acidimicrobiales bacterium]